MHTNKIMLKINSKVSKFLIGAFVALALVVSTSASAADFGSMTLKVGSKGEYVKALQTLVGASPVDGIFGNGTKAKVMAWQSANGLTADGLFGKMSMAKANGAVSGNFPAGCTSASGFSTTTSFACTSIPSTVAGCASGAMYSSTTAALCSTGTTPTGTTDGSITATVSSYVSSGITLKKGETKHVAAVRLQATAGPVKITSVDVKFNLRPWLFMNQVSLHDSTGKVLATKALMSDKDTTELTVGSSYMVRFEGINYTVTPGTNVDLAVSGSVLATTDKLTSNVSMTTEFIKIKTMSEVGYVESVTPSGTSNAVTLSSTASTADVYSRLSPTSPLTGQQIVNANNITTDALLAGFSLKSTNNSSTLNTLIVTMGGTATPSSTFSNFRLFAGSTSIAGGTLSGSTVTFSNLTTPLALDAWTEFSVKADIASATSGTVTVTLTPNTTNVVVTDANYGTPTIQAGARTSNVLTLTQNSVTVSATTATLGSAIVQSNVTTGYNASYVFTLTNNSNNDLYVSGTPATFVSSTTTGGATAATSALTSMTLSPSTVSGDDAGGLYYSIPTGTSRTFTFAAALRGALGGSTLFKATAINYGTTTGALTANSISSGLASLSLTASF